MSHIVRLYASHLIQNGCLFYRKEEEINYEKTEVGFIVCKPIASYGYS